MNLFICTTPLQSIIVKSILKLEGLNKNSVEIFYECKPGDIENNSPFYLDISDMACCSTFHCDNLSFLKYIDFYSSKFKGKVYNNIYLSSIHSVHFHFILSFVKFEKLITFDDGTANIIEGSIYRRKRKSSLLKRICYIACGNKFTMDKVIETSKLHYTLYPDFKNIHSKTIPISIFDFSLKECTETNVCHVFLGTVFEEVSSMPKDADYLETKTHALLNSLIENDANVYYLPHPRQKKVSFSNAILLSNSTIAERHVMNLLSKYKFVYLYGFASSAQFNVLGATKRIKNHVLFSKNIKPIFCELERMLISRDAVEINID